MKRISRRTLLAMTSAALLLPLVGCGSGNGKSEPITEDAARLVDPPTRGVGSFYWQTRIPGLTKESIPTLGVSKPDDNTLRVSATNNNITTVYVLDIQNGKILSQQNYPKGSREAAVAMGNPDPVPSTVIKGAPPEVTYNSDEQFVSRNDPVINQALWSFPTPDQRFKQFDQVRFPLAGSDGTIYLVTRDMSAKVTVRALDGVTGETKWVSEGSLLASDMYGFIDSPLTLTSAGLLLSENGFVDAGGPFQSVRKSLTYLDPATGRIARKVPLFDSRGIWNVRPSTIVGPDETIIGTHKDSVVAIRTK